MKKSNRSRFGSPLLALFLLAFGLVPPATVRAEQEIGFIETFALAKDRAEALKLLIPGTEDYYFFHALHAQNEGRLQDVDALLEPWIKRHGETQRVWQIRHRQALLRHGDDPKATIEYLNHHLGLTFNHTQPRLDAKPRFPTALDPKLVSWRAFLDRAFRNSDTTSLVSDAGLDRLLRDDVPLDEKRRRDLLARLHYPDYPRLAGLVAADLRTRESGGFGEFDIHRRLLPAQLDELAGLLPELRDNPAFVQTRARKLQPGADTDWRRDAAAREAYLTRLWDFAKSLSPAFNSLKVHTLHQLLDHKRRAGDYPRDLFFEYVKLPRAVHYVEPDWLRQTARDGGPADLNADFREITSLPPIGNDEALVRDFLLRFFAEGATRESYAAYLREDWLKPLFAEAKLTAGAGDPEEWFSLLEPAAVQALKDRVDLEFAPENPATFAPEDPVKLDLFVKNAGKLMVKIYEINALNYYLDQKRELNTDLNLDGLAPNDEQAFEFDDPPIHRARRSFTFDSLTGKRGAWVIEFIGNGRSSRALIRKGKLQYLSQETPAGVALRVLTEANEPAKKPSVWFGGREFRPNEGDETGTILLPYSNDPGEKPVVLTDGDFSSIEWLDLPAENYELEAAFHVDRENLLPGNRARIAVRPRLFVNGQPGAVALIEEPELVIRSTDLDGVESVETVPNFKLFGDRESIHEFRVPERLVSLDVALNGGIESLSGGGERIDVEDADFFELNTVDAAPHVADIFLSLIDNRHVAEVFGKTGEPLADRAVRCAFRHRDFTDVFGVTLKTDDRGRIDLGALEGIELLSVESDGCPGHDWTLPDFADRNARFASIHAKAGDIIRLPVARGGGAAKPEDLVLLETRGGEFVAEHFGKTTLRDGVLEIAGLAPGDYELFLRGPGEKIAIRVTEALAEQSGYALSRFRNLEIKNAAPLQIASIDTGGDALRIRLLNAGPRTRVHLAAARFVPEFDLMSLGEPASSEPVAVSRASSESLFVSGRDIGEEHRYILERRNARKFPGLMLPRAGLLLNPWAIEETRTATDEAAAGTEYDRQADAKKSQRGAMEKPAAAPPEPHPAAAPPTFSSYDFLAKAAPIAYNLLPDENGVITVKRADLGDRTHVQVLAVDDDDAAFRRISLPEPENGVAVRDLRLTQNLDPQKHFSQRQKVTVLREGESLTLADLRGSELETYDTVASVFTALAAAREDEVFAGFGFLTTWPTLDAARKRELYSKYACHELNFFLFRRDPAFFDAAVKPHLANKKDKTFLDDYLVGADLAPYTDPWHFGRLNLFERILLARRLGGDETAATARHVRELFELQPPAPERDAWYFQSALRGRRLAGGEAGAALGLVKDLGDFDRGERFAYSGEANAATIMSVARELSSKRGGVAAIAGRMVTPDDATVELGKVVSGSPAAIVADGFAAMPAIRQEMEERLAEGREYSLAQLALVAEPIKAERLKRRALFRKLEETKEWAENNYHHRRIGEQLADLVAANAFWRDFAAWDGQGGFYSREFPAASANRTEMLLALAVLDVPFEAGDHDLTIENNRLTLKAKSPLIAFHQEVEESPVADDRPPILVSQNFFREGDRVRHDGNETVDKFVTGEFLTGALYGGQIVITNPTSSTQRLAVLEQIPRGALPANGSDYTKTEHVSLEPFSTQKLEYFFYFPAPSGDQAFAHYPVQVAKDEAVIAWAEPFAFKVVDKLSVTDKSSWEYLSSFGTDREVIAFLDQNNVHRLDLSRVACRCRENVDFFREVTALLAKRHAWDATLWSYGLYLNDTPTARQYLLHREDFLRQCGPAIECELVSIEPVERHWYQHLEYQPLVNARAHRLGRERSILNDRFRAQYQGYMNLLAYRPELSPSDRLGVAYYLLLQDRVEEGLDWLAGVAPDSVDTRLQYDYLAACAALWREDAAAAGNIAAAYADYPVDRWRERFAQLSGQVREIQGAEAAPEKVTNAAPDRERDQETLAATEPGFEIETEGRQVTLSYRNLDRVRVNYYEMDLEFLFSSNPFVSADSARFSYIRPNVTLLKDLPAGQSSLSFEIPPQFASKNVLVEVTGAGRKETAAVYANALDVRLVENYGRLDVLHTETGKPAAKVYVKVYARFEDGGVKFFKDGYTDLRGKFDYVSLNTGELDRVERFSVLVMSEKDGALVREAAPPAR